MKSYYRKYELLDYKQLFIPVHTDNHWFLITFAENVLEAYDPYNYPQASTSEKSRLLKLKKKNLMKILRVLEEKYFKPLFELKKRNFQPFTLLVNLPPDIPAQNNSSDCGVFLVTIIKYLVMGKEFDFDTDSMKAIRARMKSELMNKKLEFDTEILGQNDEVNVEDLGLKEDLAIHKDTPKNKKPDLENSSIKNIHKQVLDYDESVQCFTFQNFGLDIIVETLGKKVTCISCLQMFLRIDLHWKNVTECADAVEIDKFRIAFNKHKAERQKLIKRLKNKRYTERKMLDDADAWREYMKNRQKAPKAYN